MTLVERFISLRHWSPARKSTALMATALVVHVCIYFVASSVLTGSASFRVDIGLRFLGLWTLVVALMMFVSLGVHRLGSRGDWTPYMIVAIYGAFTLVLVQLTGTSSSPFLAIPPTVILLVTVWFGVRIGSFALLYGAVLFLATLKLESVNLLPYAALIVDRSIDAQRGLGWTVTVAVTVVTITLFNFAFGFLMTMSRNIAEARLQRTHETLVQSNAKLIDATNLIRRYVPSQLADKIIKGEHTEVSKPERAKLTIFFSDLVGFSEVAEELEPEDLSSVLNEYFSEMTAIAQKHGGTIDEISGDAILVFFGAPNATTDKDHALRAARMALEMQQAMTQLNAKWRGAGITARLDVRMGLNTGIVTIGNFGSPERMKYAALGKHVNLAARLQAQCEPGKVLVSQATWLLINDQLACTHKGEMQLKGFHKQVMVYELAPLPSA